MELNEIINELNSISKSVDKELQELYSSLRKQKEKKQKSKTDASKVISRSPQVADISGIVPDLDAIEKQNAQSILKDITNEIKNNKADYGHIDLRDRGDDMGSKGAGEGTGEVTLLKIGRPDWFDLLDKGIARAFKRVKRKEWFDTEALNRGLIRKQKSMGLKPKNYVFLLLDVSGSMSSYSYKGTPLVELFASYLPPMVMNYDGSFIEVDGDEVNDTAFRTLSKQQMMDKIALSGGGGAEFEKAMAYVNAKIIKDKITDPCVIIATDGHEDFDAFEIPKNLFFMTTKYGVDSYGLRQLKAKGFPNHDLNQHIIVVDVD